MKVTRKELESRLILGTSDPKTCKHKDKVFLPLDETTVRKCCRRCGYTFEHRTRCQAIVTVSTHIKRRCLIPVGADHTLCFSHRDKE